MLLVTSKVSTSNFFGLNHILFKNFRLYLILFFIVISSILVEYGWKAVQFIVEDVIVKKIKEKTNKNETSSPSICSKKIENLESDVEIKLEGDVDSSSEYKINYNEELNQQEIKIKENYVDSNFDRQTSNQRRTSLYNENKKCN